MKSMEMTRRAFVAAGALALAGCGQRGEFVNEDVVAPDSMPDDVDDDSAEDGTETAETPDAAPAASGTLVAYYSRADENYADGGREWLEVGHTKVMAGYIAEALGADTYEIVPTQAYPEGYDDCCDVALQEQHDDARPAIADALPDISGYDLVFIGCPIWWGEEPMIVRTFIEGVDLAGKTVVPFTTHGGSGLGSVPSNLQTALPDAQVLDGYAVAGTSVDGARDEVVSWAKGLVQA